MELKLHYTVTEVSQMMGLNSRTVRDALREKEPGWGFPFIAAGSKIMIPVHAFNKWYREMYGIDLDKDDSGE